MSNFSKWRVTAVANTNEMHQDASYIDPSGTGPWNQVGMMPQNIYQVLKALIKTSNEVASTRNCTQLCLLATFSPAAILMYVPVKSKLKHPPPGNPRAFEFLENFCSNSPLTGPKSCLNASPPGKLPDYALVICFLCPPPPRHAGTLSGNSGEITAALQ